MSKFNNYVNIHWFTGSFDDCHVELVRAEITNLIRDTIWEIPQWQVKQGVNGYQESIRSMDDFIIIAYDIDPEFAKKIHKHRASVSFSGGFFDKWPVHHLSLFAKTVRELLIRVCHFDIYYQDADRLIEIYQLNQLFKNGQCRGFKTRRYIDSDSNGEHSGETLELGRRGSDGSGKFLRIYDKSLESKGEIAGNRWELAMSGKRSETAWTLLEMADFQPSTMAGMVFAAVDWIELTDDNHKSRWKRLDWYQKMIDTADLVAVPVIIEKTNIEKKIKWLENGVSGTLAYIRAYVHYVDCCDDGFDGLVGYMADTGRNKLHRSHLQQLLEDIKKARKGVDDGLHPLPSFDELENFCMTC